MALSSSSLHAAENWGQGIMSGGTWTPDGSFPVRIVLTNWSVDHVGTSATSDGPRGTKVFVPPVRLSPWHVRQPEMSSRYSPYAGVTAGGGATTGAVVGVCAVIGSTPNAPR